MYRSSKNFTKLFGKLANTDMDSMMLQNETSNTNAYAPSNNMKSTIGKKYKETQDSFKAIFEKSPFGSQVLTQSLLILRVNQALVNLLGYKVKDEIIGTSILEYANPEYKNDWYLLQNSLWTQEQSSFSFETCLTKKDGSMVWCEVTSILYQDGGYGLGYTIIEDISSRKEAEEAIKKSEANLRNILDNADAGYVLYNADREIVSYNALAQKFSHELYGKSLSDGGYILEYFPEDRHQMLLDITAKVIAGGEVCYEILIKNEFGEKWMEVKWLSVKNHENKNWGFILASKDVTEKKMAAAEREKMTSDLISRNKELEQFTNITSHNLRAPVANIIGLLELIEEMDMSEAENKEMLDGILLSARNLDSVINDINQILTVKDKQYEAKENVYFEQLVNSIKTSINNVIVKEHVAIKCNFDELESIFTVRTYLYSIFYNLVLNSIKYRRIGVEPVITINSKIDDDKVLLAFTDNGKGIDMVRNGNNLFGLYKRFDSSVEGKGLGLFMVKAQIESIGGSISVESQVGQGTTFTVELPINK